jgi:hypothetical protein
MKRFANKPKAYRVSVFSLFILLALSALSFPAAWVTSLFYTGWAALGAFVFVLLPFGVLSFAACLTSFISGLHIVTEYKHTLIWLIPEGLLLLGLIGALIGLRY